MEVERFKGEGGLSQIEITGFFASLESQGESFKMSNLVKPRKDPEDDEDDEESEYEDWEEVMIHLIHAQVGVIIIAALVFLVRKIRRCLYG